MNTEDGAQVPKVYLPDPTNDEMLTMTGYDWWRYKAAIEAEAKIVPVDEPTFLADVAAEIVKARAKHANMNSLHEAYAVILEELDEFWDEVRAWHGSKGDADAVKARKELVQIAAMAMRAAEDLL